MDGWMKKEGRTGLGLGIYRRMEQRAATESPEFQAPHECRDPQRSEGRVGFRVYGACQNPVVGAVQGTPEEGRKEGRV